MTSSASLQTPAEQPHLAAEPFSPRRPVAPRAGALVTLLVLLAVVAALILVLRAR